MKKIRVQTPEGTITMQGDRIQAHCNGAKMLKKEHILKMVITQQFKFLRIVLKKYG